jgi:hypothetical protein
MALRTIMIRRVIAAVATFGLGGAGGYLISKGWAESQ